MLDDLPVGEGLSGASSGDCPVWGPLTDSASEGSPFVTPFAASDLTCPVYKFIRVRSRRALVTACPYPSLLK